MSDPDFIDVLTEAAYGPKHGVRPFSKDDIRAALRALVAYRANPPATPVSSPSEWAQARQRLRDASTLVQITEFGNPSFPLRLNGLTDAADAILAIGDPAPAAPASELPLLRELRGWSEGYRRAAPKSEWERGNATATNSFIAKIDALIARASSQAGGES